MGRNTRHGDVVNRPAGALDPAEVLRRLEEATQRAKEATAEAREATRTAHEALRDLATARKSVQSQRDELAVAMHAMAEDIGRSAVTLMQMQEDKFRAYGDSRVHMFIDIVNENLDITEKLVRECVSETMATILGVAASASARWLNDQGLVVIPPTKMIVDRASRAKFLAESTGITNKMFDARPHPRLTCGEADCAGGHDAPT